METFFQYALDEHLGLQFLLTQCTYVASGKVQNRNALRVQNPVFFVVTHCVPMEAKSSVFRFSLRNLAGHLEQVLRTSVDWSSSVRRGEFIFRKEGGHFGKVGT